MKVKIGAIEISDVTAAELDALIKRYGKVPGGVPSSSAVAENGDVGGAALSKDGIVLKRLIEAGNSGVKINDLGEILGKRGKAARGVIQKWSIRIGLGDATTRVHLLLVEPGRARRRIRQRDVRSRRRRAQRGRDGGGRSQETRQEVFSDHGARSTPPYLRGPSAAPSWCRAQLPAERPIPNKLALGDSPVPTAQCATTRATPA